MKRNLLPAGDDNSEGLLQVFLWYNRYSHELVEMFAVYFAESLKNGKVYVGHTNKEPRARVKEHNEGTNKWSRLNGPFKLIYYEKYNCKEDAAFRENFYKSGFGRQVKKLIIDILGA